jgi:2-methylcitrate dehydratase PrpD
MNLSYAVAVCLQDGQVFVDQYTPERIHRPDTVALTRKVRVIATDEFNHLGRTGRHGVRVIARMQDGRTAERTVLHATGSAHRPVTPDQIVAKFRRLAAKVLPAAQVEELLEAVMHLENMADVSDLARLLVPASN